MNTLFIARLCKLTLQIVLYLLTSPSKLWIDCCSLSWKYDSHLVNPQLRLTSFAPVPFPRLCCRVVRNGSQQRVALTIVHTIYIRTYTITIVEYFISFFFMFHPYQSFKRARR